MAQMTGGRALVESLEAHGVGTVFGLVSIHMMGVYDALYEARSRVRLIGARHEQALVYMADGYTRATGRPGVCLTSTGPGAANTLGAMGEAYFGSSAVLQVTSNVDAALIDSGRRALHEPRGQLAMFRGVTGWQAQCRTVGEVPHAVFEAFFRFATQPPRPAIIEIATDAIHASGEAEILAPRVHSLLNAPADAVERAAELLSFAKRPVIIAGGGVLAGEAWAELRRLAEELEIPVVTTQAGKGAFPGNHSLSLGCLRGGRAYGHNPLHDFLPGCDVALVVGSHLDHGETVGVGLKLPQTLLHINLDVDAFDKNYHATVRLHGHAKRVLSGLSQAMQGRPRAWGSAFLNEAAAAKRNYVASLRARGPNQQRVMDALRATIPADGIVVTDATVPAYWAAQGFPVEEPRTYLGPHGWAGIGFGWPAALGAKVGRPDKPVVLISGDGGFQLNLQELATAAQERIPVIATIWNDKAWGVLKDMQRDRFGGRYLGTSLDHPDFVRLTEAYGLRATRVHTLDQLIRVLEAAVGRNEFHLIEVVMPDGFAAFK